MVLYGMVGFMSDDDGWDNQAVEKGVRAYEAQLIMHDEYQE